MEALPKAIGSRVIGATALCFAEDGPRDGRLPAESRERRIALYLRRSSVERWAALDADPSAWQGQDPGRIVIADPARGISDPETRERLRALL